MTNEYRSDPATYRAMSAPFDSLDDVNEAVGGFWRDVERARKEHGIRDVLVVVGVAYRKEAREGDAMADMYLGDSEHAERLAAYAMGKHRLDRQALLEGFLRGEGTQDGK